MTSKAGPPGTRPPWRWGPLLALAALLPVAGLRLAFTMAAPVHTTDLLRHVLYGRLVLDHGLAMASRSLLELGLTADLVPFKEVPYNYPVLALAWFVGVAALSPTLFCARLGLTILEAANAWLLYKVTRDPWFGVLYWCLPVSIWFVSREGQFEPLQSFFVLLALLALKKRPLLAAALMGLAIQVKVTAVFLLPYLVLSLARQSPRQLWPALGALAASFLPTLAAMPWYSWIHNTAAHAALIRMNVLYINPWADLYTWAPVWLRILAQGSSWAMILVLLLNARRSSAPLAYLAPLLLLGTLKVYTNVMPWYQLLLPPTLAPIPERRVRFVLMALLLVLGADSLVETLGFGPVGPASSQAGFEALGAFSRLRVPGY